MQHEERKRESVWDYPRPPRVEPSNRLIRIVFAGETIAETRNSFRVLETSHPPVYYIPPEDVRREFLLPGDGRTLCEWKGQARYCTVLVRDRRVENAAWYYPNPRPDYEVLRDRIAFYPRPMDGCYVDGERAIPEPGTFYGGWITHDVTGPFRGVT
jgi:uncharacterized protein (DUF427 family)